jgi:phospholipase C
MVASVPQRAALLSLGLSALLVGTTRAPTQIMNHQLKMSRTFESQPFYVAPPGVRPINWLDPRRYGNKHRSYKWRHHHGVTELVQYPTPIQHVVVVYMENRTLDNLFAGYYGTTWGSTVDLANPAGSSGSPALTMRSLSWNVDPDHSHYPAFVNESMNFDNELFGCATPSCDGVAHPKAYAYVNPTQVAIYANLAQNWTLADHTLQANEGPSFIAHQYAIAGQSGALGDSVTPSPNATGFAMAENPVAGPTPTPVGGILSEPYIGTTGNCFTPTQASQAVDMKLPYSGGPDPNVYYPPCVDYNTVLDEIGAAFNAPPSPMPTDYSWEYVAAKQDSIWAAPMGVQHLYNNYESDPNNPFQPFQVDPNAQALVEKLYSVDPIEPFAALTYVTPCLDESDHPNTQPNSTDYGPQWLGWLINAIGNSRYWPNTTIIVTWDDWGGWYDHYLIPGNGPYHPPNNVYNVIWPQSMDQDANEWGFRVPMIVISPYVSSRGYVSHVLRSQSALLDYIEYTFGLQALGTDDEYQQWNPATGGGLADMFNTQWTNPLPYTDVSPATTWTGGGCQTGQ